MTELDKSAPLLLSVLNASAGERRAIFERLAQEFGAQGIHECDGTAVDIDGAGKALRLSTRHVGKLIKGKGIYLGIWKPDDRNEQSLKKQFDVFAAPTNLLNQSGKNFLLNYKDAVLRVSKLKNFHGRDGASFQSDEDIYDAIRHSKFAELRKWFIPTADILSGDHVISEQHFRFNLYNVLLQFQSAALDEKTPLTRDQYWSCSVVPDFPDHVVTLNNALGLSVEARIDKFQRQTRLVCAELRTPNFK